jgi:uncharacterized HAD superfamily protein
VSVQGEENRLEATGAILKKGQLHYHHLELAGTRHRKFLEQIKKPLHSHPA